MVIKAIILFAAVCTHSVLGSYFHGPTAKPVVLKSGYLADTHEVAAAKGAHLAALAKEAHYGYGDNSSGSYVGDYDLSYDNGHDVKYNGPTAIPHVLRSGHIADTHEVAVAKAEHFAAVSKAKAHGGYGYAGDYEYGRSYRFSQGGNDVYGHGHDIKYHGPTAKPVVLKSGYLADTHEVAAAKGAHLAALAKEANNHGYDGEYSGSYTGDHSYGHGHDVKYHGPTAIPHVLKSGFLADTHEVAAAKGAHLAALAKEANNHGYDGEYSGSYTGDHSYGHGHDVKYHGPTAIPHVLKSGHIADTHEVSAAKAEHYTAVSKAKSQGGYGYGGSEGYSQGGHGDHGIYGHGHDIRYHGPTAIPHVLKSGHIADTHEVSAAKAEHYTAVSKAKSHGGYGYAGVNGYDQVDSLGHDHSHPSYQGALARPSPLPSGYLADTHEVQAARHHHIQAINNRHY